MGKKSRRKREAAADAEVQQVGRIALRVEGNQWVAYYALPDTMKDALWLGAMHYGAAHVPGVRDAFMDLMRTVVGHILAEQTGGEVSWKEPTPGPEHEKAGRG